MSWWIVAKVAVINRWLLRKGLTAPDESTAHHTNEAALKNVKPGEYFLTYLEQRITCFFRGYCKYNSRASQPKFTFTIP